MRTLTPPWGVRHSILLWLKRADCKCLQCYRTPNFCPDDDRSIWSKCRQHFLSKSLYNEIPSLCRIILVHKWLVCYTLFLLNCDCHNVYAGTSLLKCVYDLHISTSVLGSGTCWPCHLVVFVTLPPMSILTSWHYSFTLFVPFKGTLFFFSPFWKFVYIAQCLYYVQIELIIHWKFQCEFDICEDWTC